MANPPFPRPAGYWWFGCRSATKGSLGNLKSEQKEVRDKVLSALIQADPKGPGGVSARPPADPGVSAEEYRDESSVRGGQSDHVDDLILDAGRRDACRHEMAVETGPGGGGSGSRESVPLGLHLNSHGLCSKSTMILRSTVQLGQQNVR